MLKCGARRGSTKPVTLICILPFACVNAVAQNAASCHRGLPDVPDGQELEVVLLLEQRLQLLAIADEGDVDAIVGAQHARTRLGPDLRFGSLGARRGK